MPIEYDFTPHTFLSYKLNMLCINDLGSPRKRRRRLRWIPLFAGLYCLQALLMLPASQCTQPLSFLQTDPGSSDAEFSSISSSRSVWLGCNRNVHVVLHAARPPWLARARLPSVCCRSSKSSSSLPIH